MKYEMAGDPVKDSTYFKEVSPVFHVDKIKAKLFIAQGANDPRVNKEEADQMVAAMKEKGIDVEYMVKENEGHGFHNEENRFDFYRAMEKFLSKNLLEKEENEKAE
jgi:dipeptidyl aminopeptidase/acylaminoacyl peptidase